MCGIAGFFDPRRGTSEEVLLRTASAMARALAHRGPDGSGAWADAASGIALGHRRLAIVDLSPLGSQPMVSADGRYVISYNGEVYNFRDLREELEPRGHKFRGHSDTEVMLAAISEWGLVDAVQRFVGMFAFALWDRSERTLSLVRDRMGIKPLYWTRQGNLVLFGSELKALRAHPGFQSSVDRGALAAYLRHNYVPAPWSMYQGVFKLRPGHVLRLHADGSERSEPFWDLRKVAREGVCDRLVLDDREATDRLEALLKDAVARRMIADVPLGAFLSGGIDSSTVVALMQAQSTRPVRTFSIGFGEERYNEAPYAAAVARHLGTDHTELRVSAQDALAVIPSLAEWFDEPLADSSQIPTFLVSKLAREQVTVALSGDGGDELFAGYYQYALAERIWRRVARIPGPARRGVAGLLETLPARLFDRVTGMLPRRFRPRLVQDRLAKLAQGLGGPGADTLHRVLISFWSDPEALVSGSREPKGILWDTALAGEIPDFVERMQFLDQVTYLPDDILVKLDRASMAVSLEARVPILDHRVVELSWRLDRALKVRGGSAKWILRQVLDRYLPRSLVERPKMGFAVPLDGWLKGPLRDWSESLLDEARLRREGFLDPGPIRETWKAHLDGRARRELSLWGVLMFQAWLERQGSRS